MAFQDGGLIHSYFKTEDYKADAYWANEIKKGGYVLHFRHGQKRSGILLLLTMLMK